ncbi:zinc phosphodiesterase ELAC protein 2-like isoform X2 [Tubulanus polymorphus]|uniref:zinc phosphodiesterase ELAC protein 2-like isoform X2 n=1 Tax=Tubulanus polymorphus TaxID=672921 RepID=UPI003DA1CAC0
MISNIRKLCVRFHYQKQQICETSLSLFYKTSSSYLSRGYYSSVNMNAKNKLPNKGRTLRHVRYKKQLKGKLPVPGLMYLQVVGSGGRGAPKSVVLTTEQHKYLFNCGECTQRIFTEHKMKPSRLEHIFITHRNWQNIGGLLGMALTLQANNVPHITIHGPDSVEKVVMYTRGFAELQFMKLSKSEVSDKEYKDHALSIEYLPIHSHKISNSETSLSNEESGPDEKRRKVPDAADLDMAVSYICRPTLFPRKMDIEKCKELGVPFGPLVGQLKNGNVINMPDGRVIQPDDVLSPQPVSYPFLIVDCPNEHFLSNFTSCERWNELVSEEPQLIVHFTPHSLINTEKYQNWLRMFPSSTKHLMLDGSDEGLVSSSIYRIQATLNLLSEDMFPLLPAQQKNVDKRSTSDNNQNRVIGKTNAIYHIRPKSGFDFEQCIVIDNELDINSALEQEGVVEALEKMRTDLKSINRDRTKTHQYPELVFLGTGSSVPSKDRNVSCIIVHLTADKSILLDCGEGSLAQLWRHYGDETPDILRRIKGIYISHMHADHHMGLFNIILARQHYFPDDMSEFPVLAPLQFNRWFQRYKQYLQSPHENIRFSMVPLQNVMLHDVHDYTDIKLYEKVIRMFDFEKMDVVYVEHCKNSFGIAITHKQGWKITYSGDTMPTQNLVQAGIDSDILIHEATMEDGMEDDAKFKTHRLTTFKCGYR